MNTSAEVAISIISALGLRELLSFAVKWYKDNNDSARQAKLIKQQDLDKEIDSLRAKIDIIQMQLHQTQQRNVKLETAMTLSLQFIERTQPDSREIVEDIRALLK